MGLLDGLKAVGRGIGRGFDRAAIGSVLAATPGLAEEDLSKEQKALLRGLLLSSIGRSIATLTPGFLPRHIAVGSAITAPLAESKQDEVVRRAIEAAPSYQEKAMIAMRAGKENLAKMFFSLAEEEQKKREPVGGLQTVIRDGQPATGYMTREGRFVPIPGVEPARNLMSVDVGGKNVLIDPLTGKPRAEMEKTITPDTQARLTQDESQFTRRLQFDRGQADRRYNLDIEDLKLRARSLGLQQQRLGLEQERLNLQRQQVAAGERPQARVVSQLAGIDTTMQYLQQLRDSVERNGLVANPWSPVRVEQQSLAKQVLMSTKNAEELGALQKPEIELMEQYVPNPTNANSLFLGKDLALKRIDTLMHTLRTKKNTLMEANGVVQTNLGYRVLSGANLWGGQSDVTGATADDVFEYVPGQGLRRR